MEERSCIVAGHICLDVIPAISMKRGFIEAIRPGHLLAIGAPTLAPGGTVSNTGLALHKLGIKTSLMGKLGEDSFGGELLSLLSAQDGELVSGLRTMPGEDTSYTIILSPPDADRVFLHSTGANDTFGPEDVNYEALQKADLFHFGYPTAMARMYADDGAEMAELLRRAKETGVTTTVDTSMFDRQGPAGQTNWERFLARVLPFVDVFMPSLEEILLMLRPEETASEGDPLLSREVAARLLDYGAKIILLKQGIHGLYLRTQRIDPEDGVGRALRDINDRWRGRELWAPSFKVRVVGTTGAGDCAVGAFLAAILRRLAPEEALIAAAAAGACNAEAADATSGLLSWPEMMARVEAGWEQNALSLTGWRFDKAARLWLGAQDARFA